MKIVTNKQMQEIDRDTIEKQGVPGLTLMENAGKACVKHILKCISHICHSDRPRAKGEGERRNPLNNKGKGSLDSAPSTRSARSGQAQKGLARDDNYGGLVTIFCGKGNNGGDGFVIVRLLKEKGFDVNVFLIGEGSDLKGDAKINYERYLKLGKVKEIKNESNASIIPHPSSLIIIDAIFGTGLSSEVKGIYKQVIENINNAGKYIFSVDIPSGIHGDTGEVLGVAVKANETVTFGLPKFGHFFKDGREFSGKLHIEDIGLSPKSIKKVNSMINVLIEDEILKIFKKRKPESHKGTYGHVFIIGGSSGKTGAPKMAAMAALKSGAGLVTLGIPKAIETSIEKFHVETMSESLADKDGMLSASACPKILELSKNKDVICYGPGIGLNDEIVNLTKELIKQSEKPIVIDADGINAIAKDIKVLKDKKSTLILTPHPGEMARLISKDTKYVNENRVEIARNFAKENDVILVLKGHETVIADINGEVFINTTGNPGMATAGMGDALSGMIAAFAAGPYEILEGTLLGVYLHGLAGDLAIKDVGETGLTTSDLIKYIPKAIKYFEETK